MITAITYSGRNSRAVEDLLETFLKMSMTETVGIIQQRNPEENHREISETNSKRNFMRNAY